MSQRNAPIRVAVTGGPGAGKTSLLERLRDLGYPVVPEVAREIIVQRKSEGLSPRPSPVQFARMIMEHDIERYASSVMASKTDVIFFDRSLIDSLGMMAQLKQLPDSHKSKLLARYRYHRTAFILPPWREIYQTDTERDQSFDEAVSVFYALRDWYAECGYDLIEVPTGTIDQRCEFVLQSLKEGVGTVTYF